MLLLVSVLLTARLRIVNQPINQVTFHVFGAHQRRQWTMTEKANVWMMVLARML